VAEDDAQAILALKFTPVNSGEIKIEWQIRMAKIQQYPE
jgi:hypothetical protein